MAVHDLVIQKDKNELLLGTHGRSIYKTQLNVFSDYLEKKSSDSEITIIGIDGPKYSNRWGEINKSESIIIDKSELPSSSYIQVDLFSEVSSSVEYILMNKNKKILKSGMVDLDKGFNKIKLRPTVSKNLSEKQLKKLVDQYKIGDDGDVYFGKGKFIFRIGTTSKEFLVK